MKNDHSKNTTDKGDNMEINQRIGNYANLKKEMEKVKEELDQVKIQRDLALKKQNKLLNLIKELRKIIET
tara:strand:+ start:392 stop:601 length:210 start_codon:yes stop_codon:yes gene_type:complete